MFPSYQKIYELIRFSPLYNTYLRFFRKTIYQNLKTEQQLYDQLSPARFDLVFDIGANVGDKSALFTKFSRRIVAVEPDIHNWKILKYRFKFNNKIEVENIALGQEEGTGKFYVLQAGSPANTLSKKWKKILEDPKENRWSKKLAFGLSYEVETRTFHYLINKYGIPDYVKIDVEGYESQVIGSLNVPISILSFEANFPEFKNETLLCIEHLFELNPAYVFNCIDENFVFFFKDHLRKDEIIQWLQKTEKRYFEVFCFAGKNDSG